MYPLIRRYSYNLWNNYNVPDTLSKKEISTWINQRNSGLVADSNPLQYLAQRSHTLSRLAATTNEDDALEVVEQLYQTLLKNKAIGPPKPLNGMKMQKLKL